MFELSIGYDLGISYRSDKVLGLKGQKTRLLCLGLRYSNSLLYAFELYECLLGLCLILLAPIVLQGGAKNGAILSYCKYSENSMTELRGNW